jgi:hypothetical protein
MPMPPTPSTMTTWPGRTSAELTAAPQPVLTPQLVRAATSMGMSAGIFTADLTDTVEYWLKVATPAPWPSGFPSSSMRLVPSGRVPARTSLPLSQRFCIPEAHHLHRPHMGRKLSTTLSPGFQPSVFGPTSTTVPAPSWPPAIGSAPAGI